MTVRDRIETSIAQVRERLGPEYPRHQAELKSLVSWLEEDILHNMEPRESVERIVGEIIADTSGK